MEQPRGQTISSKCNRWSTCRIVSNVGTIGFQKQGNAVKRGVFDLDENVLELNSLILFRN